MTTTWITVAICTLDRKHSLEETLASLRDQQCAASWEILAVDNGSSDGTAALVEATAASFKIPLRCECEPRRGLARARNTALAKARGEIVLFIDDDVTCAPGWVAAHARAFEDRHCFGTGGRIVPRLPPETPSWIVRSIAEEIGGPTSRYEFGERGFDIATRRGVPPPFGANMGVRRKVALDHGGFPEDLGWGAGMPGEETALFRAVLGSGGTLRYVPDAVVEHRIAPDRLTLDYYRRWYFGHGRSIVRMDPPAHRMALLGRVVVELRRLLVWRIRLARADAERDPLRFAHALRRRYKASGRLAQLLRGMR